ncbi:hypothetical protein V5O48_015770 [Marasmius crinis-equi]|uniref:F-box domain-containing protein n=1 Tax=Marasmius crinis-equi TaxID=585013 RepID=A0ABR3ETX0_9AGAR
MSTPIELARLQFLCLDDQLEDRGSKENSDILYLLLTSLTTPSLLHLRLRCKDMKGGWPTALLAMFRRSMSSLGELALDISAFRLQESLDLVALLELTPTLTELKVLCARDERDGSNCSEKPHRPLSIATPFVSDLLAKLKEPYSSSCRFLPHLECITLTLNGVLLDPKTVATILEIGSSKDRRYSDVNSTKSLTSILLERIPNRWQLKKDFYPMSTLEPEILDAIADLAHDGVKILY